MHFLKSTIVFALAFATFAVAAPGGTALEVRGGGGECKALLESCSTNSECCSDLCLIGVRIPFIAPNSMLIIFCDVKVVRLRRCRSLPPSQTSKRIILVR
jgi:hypothetical protein